jgi:DTW domain-containing protein
MSSSSDNSTHKKVVHHRQRKTKNPCKNCGLHLNFCICHIIPRIELATRVTLLIHHRELKRTTNTGQLAIKSLVNSDLRIRGLKDNPPLDLTDILNDTYRPVLFFPADDAIELTKEFVALNDKPIHLIVPDGNWRQASKVHTRHSELQNIPRVKISQPNTKTFHLRAEHTPEGMSTLMAIASALAIIEGPEKIEPLFALFEAKLRNTLIGRGVKL